MEAFKAQRGAGIPPNRIFDRWHIRQDGRASVEGACRAALTPVLAHEPALDCSRETKVYSTTKVTRHGIVRQMSSERTLLRDRQQHRRATSVDNHPLRQLRKVLLQVLLLYTVHSEPLVLWA